MDITVSRWASLFIMNIQHSNIAEEELGQIHGAIHIHLNAIEAVRARMNTGPSLSQCEECGNEIPEGRRLVVQGCRTCITCQTELEGKHHATKK